MSTGSRAGELDLLVVAGDCGVSISVRSETLLRSGDGAAECRGEVGVAERLGVDIVVACKDFCDSTQFTMLLMFPGREDLVMTVVTPAEVASRAATSFVDIPPVPKLEPRLETSTWSNDISSITWIGFASG